MYLVTSKENKTFGDFEWGSEVVNETDNPNYYYRLYETIEEAICLYPFFNNKDFNVWIAEGLGECVEERTSKKFSKAKTISLVDFDLTDDKRIAIAILCCLNLVKNNDFVDWCCSYFLKEEGVKEKAYVIKESISDTDDESEYFSCAIPLLSCVSSNEKIKEFTAASIFRSISDSFDISDPIDLNKIFKIASFVPPQDIASIIR